VGVVSNLAADEEKGGLYASFRQTIQQAGGGGAAGAVIKGKGDEFLLRQLGGGVNRQHTLPDTQGEGQTDYRNCQNDHHPPLLKLTHAPRPRFAVVWHSMCRAAG